MKSSPNDISADVDAAFLAKFVNFFISNINSKKKREKQRKKAKPFNAKYQGNKKLSKAFNLPFPHLRVRVF